MSQENEVQDPDHVIPERVERSKKSTASVEIVETPTSVEKVEAPLPVEKVEAPLPVEKVETPTVKKTMKKTIKKKVAKKKAPSKVEAVVPEKKKRIRRTKAQIEADNLKAQQAKATATPKAPAKKKAVIKKAAAKKAVTKKPEKKAEWRKGRVWPVSRFDIHISVMTKSPKKLEDAIRKALWHFTEHPGKGSKPAE